MLQNADDAHATKAFFILTATGVAFVHNGGWFTVSNFRSLADGWSDKDPAECIGHKGLGFRSVLDITPAPHLIRLHRDFLAIKFSWSLNNGHIQETLKKQPRLREHYQSWTKHGQSACPVMAIPGEAKKISLGEGSLLFDQLNAGRYEAPCTTMFWFPATDPDTPRSVLNDLGVVPFTSDAASRKKLTNFLKNEVRILLPFLTSLQEVRLYDGNRCLATARTEGFTSNEATAEVTVLCEVDGEQTETRFFQLRAAIPIPAHVRDAPQTPRAVRQLKAAKLKISIGLDNGVPRADPNARFHVYFPTEEASGIGFDVHADFFVKPDRTRLMPGSYNEWLLQNAAKRAAGDFLTAILDRYPPAASLGAMAPTRPPQTEAAEKFISSFSTALKNRTAPFIPTRRGLSVPKEVIIPPSLDTDGFWQRHFSEPDCILLLKKGLFLDPESDNARVRAFLKLADVLPLEPLTLLDLIETSAQRKQQPIWWYECYKYLSSNEHSSRWTQSALTGRKLIPTDQGGVCPVPPEGSSAVCLAPQGSAAQICVPQCFADVFVFLDSELSALVIGRDDPVRSWMLRSLQIARFEATDLLPRAVRATVTKLFATGGIKVSLEYLRDIWSFVQRIISTSRGILSPDFWQEIGRLPVPSVMPADTSDSLEPSTLIPAFLAYFPDSRLGTDEPIVGISGLRRVAADFLNPPTDDIPSDRWLQLLRNAHVSSEVKILTYRRVVTSTADVPLISPISPRSYQGFSGERQHDENLAVLAQLSAEPLWESFLRGAPLCTHPSKPVIHSLTLIEGIQQSAALADQEYRNHNENWRHRLKALLNQIPSTLLTAPSSDSAFCRAGAPGGHSIHLGNYAALQLDTYHWLPSTCGPRSRAESFYRAATRRVISAGPTGEELGDTLLPYVVADSLNEQVQLANLGIEALDDLPSASTSAMTRALVALGERLSTETAMAEIVAVRARWRLVRGALQEIYRTINQPAHSPVFAQGTRFAAKLGTATSFESPPLYHAESGSAIEEAFIASLPMFDADRPYTKLFDALGITRLMSGDTVEETLLPNLSAPANEIRDEIVQRLAPFLLSVLIVKSDRRSHIELVRRRLLTRFDVELAQPLSVRFSLKSEPYTTRTIDLQGFYLQRTLSPTAGAIEEFHYTLYIAGTPPIRFFDLDGDALGDAIAPLFLDGIAEEHLSALFPRITARYVNVVGDESEMREFLKSHLGVSPDAQDEAQTPTGQPQSRPPITPLPPPPLRVVPSGPVVTSTTLEQRIEQQRTEATASVNRIVSQISHATQTPRSQQQTPVPGSPSSHPQPSSGAFPTPEQQQRGKLGEIELSRRLRLPGGYNDLCFLEDKTTAGCGYDFLCIAGEQTVEVELKTFTKDGRIVLTSTELQQAAATREAYYLVGLLDDGGPPEQWHGHVIQNPIGKLLTLGQFDIQATLQAVAANIFDF